MVAFWSDLAYNIKPEYMNLIYSLFHYYRGFTKKITVLLKGKFSSAVYSFKHKKLNQLNKTHSLGFK